MIVTLGCGCTERTDRAPIVGDIVDCVRHPEHSQAVQWVRQAR